MDALGFGGRLRLARAPELPAGWCGKQHACLSLARLARYDLLLFLDADVRVSPTGIAQAVTFGNLAGDGRFTKACEKLLQDRFGIPRVLLTPSCTAALEMAAMLCDLKPGDEVIMPSWTFVSTASAVVRV